MINKNLVHITKKIMKNKLLFIAITLLALASCDFRKSASKDLVTGLSTVGDGLSCDKVYLSVGDKKINRNSFTYGETVYLNFENVEGFKKIDGRVFPGILFYVIGKSGDTILKYDDLYAGYAEGMDFSPLALKPYLTAADPVHSNNRYTLHAKIWDKKGTGIFNAKLNFDVIPDKLIKIEKTNVTYDELYLFSLERQVVITDGGIKDNENIYLIFEGLKGFAVEGGKVFIGQSTRLTDSEGHMILNEEDLIGDKGIDETDLKSQFAPSFILKGSVIKNPLICEYTIWDKKGDGRIRVTVDLNVESGD